MLLLSHINDHITYLFSTFSFFFLNFSSLYSPKKKKNSSFPYQSTPIVTLLPTFSLLFTILSPHYSILLYYTSLIILSFLYFDSSSFHFILYKFDIISTIQSIFFWHKTVSSLSLYLLYFVVFLFIFITFFFWFFLITLIKVDGFF